MPIGQEVVQLHSSYQPEPIAPHPYQSVVMNRKEMRPDSLLTHIGGSAIVGTYYSQLISVDDDLSGHQENRHAVLQQFRRISNFETRVQDDVNFEQEDESRRYDGSLTVVTYPTGLIPNVGDAYIILNLVQENIMFQVNQVQRNSAYKSACYTLTLSPVAYEVTRHQDLDSKVIRDDVFVKDFMSYGESPVINKGEFESLVELANLRRMLIVDYMQRFYSHRFTTFIMPGQPVPTYDPFLTNFVRKTWRFDDHALVHKLVSYHTGRGQAEENIDIFTCLIDPDRTPLSAVFRKIGVLSSATASVHLSLFSIRTTSIQQYLYPFNASYNVDNDDGMSGLIPTDTFVTLSEREPVFTQTRTRLTEHEKEPPAILPSAFDGFYVFSEAFYMGLAGSMLEELVWAYIKKQPLDLRKLVAVANTAAEWDNLSKFYFTPVVALLIRNVTKAL